MNPLVYSDLHDIQTKDDIQKLVDSFYEKVNCDDLLSPIFNKIAKVNWDEHLPIIYDFWNTILLEKKAFTGQPYPKHADLPITKKHFDRWLTHFNATLNNHFRGPTAEEAKRLASQIAMAFSHKMGLWQKREK